MTLKNTNENVILILRINSEKKSKNKIFKDAAWFLLKN